MSCANNQMSISQNNSFSVLTLNHPCKRNEFSFCCSLQCGIQQPQALLPVFSTSYCNLSALHRYNLRFVCWHQYRLTDTTLLILLTSTSSSFLTLQHHIISALICVPHHQCHAAQFSPQIRTLCVYLHFKYIPQQQCSSLYKPQFKHQNTHNSPQTAN